jgi:CcmD family protein
MRRVGVLLVLTLLTFAPGRAMAQQPPQPATPEEGQSEFVPVNELPPQEQLPAKPLLFSAYGFIWAAVLAYVFTIWRRMSVVQREIDTLKRQLRS